MKRYNILLGMVAVLFVACDKIDEADRLVPVPGVMDQWTRGEVGEVGESCAYVEKYTGPRCNNCPAADRTLEALEEQYGERLVVVAVTTKDNTFGAPLGSDADMRVPEAAAWEDAWGVNSFPTAFIGRSTATAYTGSMANIGGGIGQALAGPTVAGLVLSATAEGSGVGVDVGVKMLADYQGQVSLTLLLTEDSLAYGQLDGSAFDREYKHNNMLRALLTGTWGTEVPLEGTAGEQLSNHFSATLPDGCVVANSHVVALLTDAASREVIACKKCRIDE